MELLFDREQIRYFERVADVTLCQEETLEAIVPDACPDILRIVQVCGQAELTGKQAREGVASVSGTVRASVLYQPEGGEGLKCMEVSLPFTAQVEASGFTSEGQVTAAVRLRWAEARVLNPRKVLLRADLAIDIAAFQPVDLEICQGILEGGDQGVQQQIEQQEIDQLCAVEEKPFSFSEQLRIAGNQALAKVLSLRAEPVCTECKLIGAKLIFKGDVNVQLLYQGEDGTLMTQRQSLPFSQTMEVSGAGEDGECRVQVVLSELNGRPSEDGRSVDLDLELLAQAEVRCRRTLKLLRDAYSTAREMEVKQAVYTFQRLEEDSMRPQNVRELLETASLARSVVDAWVTLGEITRSREGDQMVLTTQACLTVLYLDEEDALQSIQKTFPVSVRVDCPEGRICLCWCQCPDEVFAAPSAGGVEVRFNVEFRCAVLSQQKVSCVSSAQLGEERTRPDGSQPSVVLRLALPGEGLWDIAKAYGTTSQEIIQANELEEGALPSGRMLLIPRVR